MFKNIYTTRMSGNAKVLQARFEKISSKPMRLSRLSAFVCVVFLVMTIALSTIVLAQFDSEGNDSQIKITNKGEVIKLKNKPFVENNTIYVPLREFFTKMGFMEHPDAKMDWDNGVILISLYDRNTKENAEAEYTGYCYKVEIGKSELVINPGEIVPLAAERDAVFTEQMQAEPILVNNITYVPYEYIQRIVERADNGIMSYPAKYTLDILYTGVSCSIAYPFEEVHNITEAFGKRVHPITGEEHFHAGIDFEAPAGTPIYAGIEGKFNVGFDEEKGAYMTIYNENGVEVTYCNLDSEIFHILWRAMYVTEGTKIAHVGNTGMSTGAHLHMEVKINGEYVDPELYLEKMNAVADIVSEMKRKGWENIRWVKGYPDKDEWKYSCVEITEEEKSLQMYTVWATTEGDYNNEITNETYRYEVTAVVKIIADEESLDGRIYEIGYIADSGRDLGAESGEGYEYLNEELLYANNRDLLDYMYSY